MIPNRGAWLEYETDSNDVFYVRVDRTRKVPITVLIRALGIGTNDEIRELFGDEPKIEASFTKDTAENYQEGLLELYKKIRPGEPLSVESAESLINAMFFDPRRYDLAKVGRYKFNKKLALKNRIRHQILAADVVDPSTGEVIASAGDKVTAELADTIQNSAVPFVYIQTEEKTVKVLSNLMVDLTHYVDCNPRDFGIHELVYYPVLDIALELSSMGIRVDKKALLDQLQKAGCPERAELPYHKAVINGELPLTIGGGIGQSRICMFFLRKAHIGEVQCSLWSDEVMETAEKNGLQLL